MLSCRVGVDLGGGGGGGRGRSRRSARGAPPQGRAEVRGWQQPLGLTCLPAFAEPLGREPSPALPWHRPSRRPYHTPSGSVQRRRPQRGGRGVRVCVWGGCLPSSQRPRSFSRGRRQGGSGAPLAALLLLLRHRLLLLSHLLSRVRGERKRRGGREVGSPHLQPRSPGASINSPGSR